MPMNAGTNHLKSMMEGKRMAAASGGKNFTTAPPTAQWKCPCGRTNPPRKERCSGCDEIRK